MAQFHEVNPVVADDPKIRRHPPLEITTIKGFPRWFFGGRQWLLLPFDMLLLDFPPSFSEQRIVAHLTENKLLNRYPFHTNPRPVMDGIMLYITKRCNLKCRYCEVCIPGEAPDMNQSVVNAAFEFIAYAARKNRNTIPITFFGGEPSLRTDIVVAMLERFRLAGIMAKGFFCTNGTISEKALHRLLPYGMEWRVSLDVPGEAYAEFDYRRGIDFDAVYRTVRAIAGHGNPLSIYTTVTRTNMHLMPLMVEKSRELGCRRIRFMPMRAAYHRSAAMPDLTPDPVEFVDMWYACRELGGDDIDVMESHLCMMFGAILAKCPSTSITPDGIVLPTVSEAHRQERLHLGNVLERDFESILSKSARLRERYFQDVEEICAGCIARRVCSGGNMAIEIMLGSRIMRNDCQIMRQFMQATCERIFAFSKRTLLPEYSGDQPVKVFRYEPFYRELPT